MRDLALAIAVVAGSPASAQDVADPTTVPLFAQTCVDGDLSLAAREAVIAANPDWVVADPAAIDVAQLATVPTLDKNFDFSKSTAVKHWTRSVNGRMAHAILASFPANRRYPSVCAIIVPGVRSMMPYYDDFKKVAKQAGLKIKSNNLPHYLEFSGKPQPNHPVRADMFSRSRASYEPNSMHLYIAF